MLEFCLGLGSCSLVSQVRSRFLDLCVRSSSHGRDFAAGNFSRAAAPLSPAPLRSSNQAEEGGQIKLMFSFLRLPPKPAETPITG